MSRLQSLRERSRETFSQMWGHGVDILEYQDAEMIRSRAAFAGHSVLRRSLGFVVLAALLNCLFALAVGIITGTAFESVYRSILSFMFTFVVNTGVAFVVGRLLGGHGRFRQFVYISALYAVPLQAVEAVLTMVCSLIPVIGFYLLLVLSVLSALARLYLSNLVTQAMMQFPKPWQRTVMFLVLVALAILKGGASVLT